MSVCMDNSGPTSSSIYSCFSSCVGLAFTDKRVTCIIVMLWIGISVGFYDELGAFDELDFLTLGPSNHTKFMGATLDSWPKWGYVACFSLMNTCVNEFVNDALVPWIQNTIQDHKTRSLPYGKMTCITINIIFTVYTQVTMLFAMFLYMSQIDFLLLRILGDILVTLYSTHMFVKAKNVDPAAYAKESSMPYERCVLPLLPNALPMSTSNVLPTVTEYPRLPFHASGTSTTTYPLVIPSNVVISPRSPPTSSPVPASLSQHTSTPRIETAVPVVVCKAIPVKHVGKT